ncbi:MAG: hypothetical protein ACRDE2_00090 [Chitinophagaceae bacterium]
MNNNPAQRYLRQAAGQARYRGVDGFIDENTSYGRRFYANAQTAAPAPQPSTAGSAALATSAPFILVVNNASGGAVTNFDIFGAYIYLINPPAGFVWNANGSLVYNNLVTISSGIPGITYSQMLSQFQTIPFTVGETYVQSSTAGQITQNLTLSTTGADGKAASNPIIMVKDPYQMQVDALVNQQRYRITSNTKLTISQLLANASVTFNFYPSDDFNPVRSLSDGQVVKSFGNPGIIRAQRVLMGTSNG